MAPVDWNRKITLESIEARLAPVRPVHIFIAMLVVALVLGLALGGFDSVQTYGRFICHDCIGIF